MSYPKNELKELMEDLHNNFANEYPDLYFDKIMTYKGVTHSMFPKYFNYINDSKRLKDFK